MKQACSSHPGLLDAAAATTTAASKIANALSPDLHRLHAVAAFSDVNSSQPGSSQACTLLAAKLAHVPALSCCSG